MDSCRLKFGAKIGENERIPANDSKFVHSAPDISGRMGKRMNTQN